MRYIAWLRPGYAPLMERWLSVPRRPRSTFPVFPFQEGPRVRISLPPPVSRILSRADGARISVLIALAVSALRWRSTPRRAVAALHKNLMHPLSCKPISSVPKLANRTPLAVVIDSFLVGTANYTSLIATDFTR